MPDLIGLTAGLHIPGGHPLVLVQDGPAPPRFEFGWGGAHEEGDRLQWFKAAQSAALTAAARTGASVLHATTLLDSAGSGWLVMGERSSGKSALAAAWWVLAGRQVLADDYVVIRENLVLAGPRVLPVRPNTAKLLQLETLESCAELPHNVPIGAPISGVIWIRTGPSERIEVLEPQQARYETSRRTLGNTTTEAAWLAIRDHQHVRLTRPFASRHLEGSLQAALRVIP